MVFLYRTGAVESTSDTAAEGAAAEPAAPVPLPPEPQYDLVKQLRLQISSANIPHPEKVLRWPAAALTSAAAHSAA